MPRVLREQGDDLDAEPIREGLHPGHLAQLAKHAAAGMPAGELPEDLVRTAGAYALQGGATPAKLALFSSSQWFAAWRTQPDWAVGFSADVRRARRVAEGLALGGESAQLAEVVGLAVVEGVALAGC